MERNEVSLLKRIINDKCFATVLCIIFSISLFFSSFVEIRSGVVIFSTFTFGCLVTHFVLRKRDHLPNVISAFKRQRKSGESAKLRTVCSRCGIIECKRHRPELNVYTAKPWMNLKVPKEVDNAFEEILNLVIEKHIYSWYSNLSKDDDFVQEIRTSLRFVFSSLLRRVCQVDLVQLITEKAANALCKHLDCYLQARKFRKPNLPMEETVLFFLGDKLHPAMQSRQEELDYLRELTSNLLPFLVQQKYLNCRAATSLVREIFCGIVLLPVMDIIGDPDMINHLLILFFDKTPMSDLPLSKEPKVEFLSNFILTHSSVKRPILHTDLQTILEDQRLLYVFMQFLKEESSLNVLQFHLSVDEFNTRILNPDLTHVELEALHLQAQQMYNTYFAPHALDRINFDDEIVQEIKDIISGRSENVIKLRTTTPLFRAYDHAYRLLENTYCPMFMQSERYFSLLCGERNSNSNAKGGGKGSKKGSSNPSAISKLGNKLKGVFTAHVDDGQMYEEESGIDLAEAMFTDSSSIASESESAYTMEDDPRLKNLSTWRVFIPQVMMRMDSNCKYYHTFRIEVQRIDVGDKDTPEDMHWTVERRYNEFYVLEAKLTEFHGELPVQLPTKRSQQNKGLAYLESKRPEFEKYLQTLLALPGLQGSELLFQFLKSPVLFTTSFLPDIKLGKMIKTVPMKLIKEKGQHLLPFLQAFIQSTEAAKPKASKEVWKEIYEEPSKALGEKLVSGLYKDNFASLSMKQSKFSGGSIVSVVDLKEIYDYILYIAIEVVRVPNLIVQLLATCDILLRQTLQAGIEWYLDVKLQQAFKPQRLAQLLNLLRDALFFEDDPPRSKRQKAERARHALRQTKDFFPRFMLTKKFDESINLMFEILQYPLLNKQISYVMLDILATELFPELLEMHRTESRTSFVQ
ncbi:sorting nexin-14 [Parasteatoda tepidariorum]|uniref:sorting nexin-14 n=1 Tax=Parasteatoda tepidariorum TaxID=114398 RepID=UPI00077FBCF0|nr:sorting nexin-14 [Parasteatoda tepidariorum]